MHLFELKATWFVVQLLPLKLSGEDVTAWRWCLPFMEPARASFCMRARFTFEPRQTSTVLMFGALRLIEARVRLDTCEQVSSMVFEEGEQSASLLCGLCQVCSWAHEERHVWPREWSRPRVLVRAPFVQVDGGGGEGAHGHLLDMMRALDEVSVIELCARKREKGGDGCRGTVKLWGRHGWTPHRMAPLWRCGVMRPPQHVHRMTIIVLLDDGHAARLDSCAL